MTDVGTKWRDRLAVVAVLLAAGCSSAARAVTGAATATTTGVATAASTAANATATAANEAWTWIWPFEDEVGPAAQRARMQEQAGPAHFRNEGFTDAKAELLVQHSSFKEHREGFVSTAFTESRDRFRTGKAQPQAGLVIGPGVTDPDVIRALLATAAQAGVPVLISQPVLAQILPAFAAQQ